MTRVCRFCDKPLSYSNARVIVVDDIYEHVDHGDCIAILQARTENLRAAVRAADVVVAIQYGDDPEDIGEETARDLYNEARAKCGEVT